MEFENKTIVITGAAGIFGRWIAAYFAREGARLCLSDILVGRFGRVTLLRIETIIEAGQKVTISCAPYQQFFAGRHAAAVLTHNYTFSS